MTGASERAVVGTDAAATALQSPITLVLLPVQRWLITVRTASFTAGLTAGGFKG